MNAILKEAAKLLNVRPLEEGEALTSKGGRFKIINAEGEPVAYACSQCQTMKQAKQFREHGTLNGRKRHRSNCKLCDAKNVEARGEARREAAAERRDAAALERLKDRKAVQ